MDTIAETIPIRKQKPRSVPAAPLDTDTIAASLPPANARNERNSLIAYMHGLPENAQAKVWTVDILDPTRLRLAETCDLLDPDMPCFVTNPAERQAILSEACNRLARFAYDYETPAPTDPDTRILASTPAGTELRRNPDGYLILVECCGTSRTHYSPGRETAAWRAFVAQATYEATGCPF